MRPYSRNGAGSPIKPYCLRGGGELFGPHHQTGRQNSRTYSPRVSKISDFSFMPFGHIAHGQISGKLICQGVAAVIFQTRGHISITGYEHFYFCFKRLKFVGGTIWGQYSISCMNHASLYDFYRAICLFLLLNGKLNSHANCVFF